MDSGVEEAIQIHQFPNEMIHFEGTFWLVLLLMEEIPGQPVDVGSLFHGFTGFCTSQVVNHQQYDTPPNKKKLGATGFFQAINFPSNQMSEMRY